MSLFFVHVPKAAGTSFRNFLLTEFPPHLRLLHSAQFNMEPERMKEFHNRPLMAGHTARSVLAKNGIARNHDYISVVREPTRRLISNINYHLRFGGKVRDIGNVKGRHILKNGIEWFLRRLPDADARAHRFVRNVQWWLLNTTGETAASEADAAKSIEDLTTVGVAERLFDSILLTAYREELTAPLSVPALNRSVGGDELRLPDDLIEQNLACDYRIYEAGVARFERDFGEMIESICSGEGVSVGWLEGLDDAERATFLAQAINRRNLDLRRNRQSKHVPPPLKFYARTGVVPFGTSSDGPAIDHVSRRAGIELHPRDWLTSNQPAMFWIGADFQTRTRVEIASCVDEEPATLTVSVNGNATSGVGAVEITLGEGTNLVEVAVSGKGLHDRARERNQPIPHNLPNLVAAIQFV